MVDPVTSNGESLRLKTARGGHRLPDEVYNPKWLARVRGRCIVTETGCWEWQGFRHPAIGTRQLPYGETNYRGKSVRVHRKMLELHLGRTLPRDLHACHTCDNPPCCNPDHLYPATNQQNHFDGGDRGRMNGQSKTHCKHGHPFDESNTYWSPRPNGRPVRNCKECDRIRRATPRYKASQQLRQQRRRERRRLARASQGASA